MLMAVPQMTKCIQSPLLPPSVAQLLFSPNCDEARFPLLKILPFSSPDFKCIHPSALFTLVIQTPSTSRARRSTLRLRTEFKISALVHLNISLVLVEKIRFVHR